jgi:hypothetical protein
MKSLLSKLLKVISALTKIIPVLIEVLEDFADDGKLNKSTKKQTTK